MNDFTESIKKYRSIVEGNAPATSAEPLNETKEKPKSAQKFKVPAYASKMIPRYFNLPIFCLDHQALISESKNFERSAVRLIARRISEGFDLREYIKPDAKSYYQLLARNINRSVIRENRWIKKSMLTEGLPSHDTSWLMRATETMRSECSAGRNCAEVINELAREYSQTEGGHHEAFEMARDALEKRAWEMGMYDDEAKNPDEEELEIDMLPISLDQRGTTEV